ncbi:uncharacterized protein K452DRAFT_352202 [Aplosporella prunicola CBS 121167]|uniref:Metallo-beta-lactamase domain-containing protein n=1 Tax=Aplosporella prunicola CBS 121167 TaxID=1176127 RepID=A0A6A6B9G8_9PEZI|nr:uncharacterized protein K452DRAFT_352202 [Aplosporella prunicola CBS 121167]KAF2139884.1 hypothetical protein K452DRAFT_352202 [Aplosporella prunicola CBS 121167]
MSTFDGFFPEFEAIRIDCFRPLPGRPPPLACFLSHVHSDHLRGLESLRAPFVYCSRATRQTLLKPIPLDTPTTIELSPGNAVRVTLLDANHCVGAVMFLIQSRAKAVLYTGDIYLDTTFASASAADQDFPSKADGVRELLDKVARYPPDTIFHFEAWTFGYEDVWVALAAFLDSPIHLDQYRWRLYKSLEVAGAPEAPPLCGFDLGNHRQRGCLTTDPHVRLHSCERGTPCPVVDGNAAVVQIVPVVTRRYDGTHVPEAGRGGGKGNLDRIAELEAPAAVLPRIHALCAQHLQDRTLLAEGLRIRLDTDDAWDLDVDADAPAHTLNDLVALLARTAQPATADSAVPDTPLPRTITFPYSRHASHRELCGLARALAPRDVYPCTVDEDAWTPESGMRALFGRFCSGDVFAHDEMMMRKREMADEGTRREEQGGERIEKDGDDDGGECQKKTERNLRD